MPKIWWICVSCGIVVSVVTGTLVPVIFQFDALAALLWGLSCGAIGTFVGGLVGSLMA